MNHPFLLPAPVIAARNNAQQLKVIMNLPVRLTTENQVIDVLPLTDDPNYVPKRVRKNLDYVSFDYPSLDDLILFFGSCRKNDLLTIKEVAGIYQVAPRTINSWVNLGLIKRYRIAPGFTVYKRNELPSLNVLYGPYEL